MILCEQSAKRALCRAGVVEQSSHSCRARASGIPPAAASPQDRSQQQLSDLQMLHVLLEAVLHRVPPDSLHNLTPCLIAEANALLSMERNALGRC